ncbi:MAG: substrate-binding domain-containing protein [Trueperaceae bacterium]
MRSRFGQVGVYTSTHRAWAACAVRTGIRVPEAVAVAGFDDIELAGQLVPPLKTAPEALAARLVHAAARLAATPSASNARGPRPRFGP